MTTGLSPARRPARSGGRGSDADRRALAGLRARGFTLIEMMAVVMIIGMVFAIGAPSLGRSKLRILKGEAETLTASLQFARQRAVMTAIPHRVLIDLEDGGYRIEWFVSENGALNASRGGGDAGGAGGFAALFANLEESGPSADVVSLRPPTGAERDYYPIAHRQLGSFTWIDDAVYFVGLESPSGWIESGDVAIVFQADGTTDPVLLELADADENHMTLEIEAVLDRVGRRDGRARS